MTKIQELVYMINGDDPSRLYYSAQIEAIIEVYAEYYAKRVLELAADNAKLSIGNWVHPKGYPYLMVNQNPNKVSGEDYFYTDKGSITNIKLPNHD